MKELEDKTVESGGRAQTPSGLAKGRRNTCRRREADEASVVRRMEEASADCISPGMMQIWIGTPEKERRCPRVREGVAPPLGSRRARIFAGKRPLG